MKRLLEVFPSDFTVVFLTFFCNMPIPDAVEFACYYSKEHASPCFYVWKLYVRAYPKFLWVYLLLCKWVIISTTSQPNWSSSHIRSCNPSLLLISVKTLVAISNSLATELVQTNDEPPLLVRVFDWTVTTKEVLTSASSVTLFSLSCIASWRIAWRLSC